MCVYKFIYNYKCMYIYICIYIYIYIILKSILSVPFVCIKQE